MYVVLYYELILKTLIGLWYKYLSGWKNSAYLVDRKWSAGRVQAVNLSRGESEREEQGLNY